jgi:serine protease
MFRKALLGLSVVLVLAPAAHATCVTPTEQRAAPIAWFDWHNATKVRQSGYGSHAVIGLTAPAGLQALRRRYRFERVRALPELRAVEVTVTRGQLRALLARAPRDAAIRYVSPLGPTRRAQAVPNDPLLTEIDPKSGLPFEWQFTAAHADRALDYSRGSFSVVVGTIDTGAADVPDLEGKVDGRWNVGADGSVTEAPPGGNDTQGHGTAIASLIAANVDDGYGMAGFGGDSHIVAMRVGDRGFTDTAVAAALLKLDSLGVRVVNMSFGSSIPDAPVVIDAIHKAAADGMLLVGSVGNDRSYAGYPAADLQPAEGARSYGLAVGASGFDGKLTSFSNSGRHLSLLAPGSYSAPCSGVLVALPAVSEFDRTCYTTFAAAGSRYGYIAGTSFSAPEVAGTAALIWAVRPTLKNWQVADIIKQSSHRAKGWTSKEGCGVLDAGAALELAVSRSDAEWAQARPLGPDACSVGGTRAAAWPETNPAPTAKALIAIGYKGKPLTLRFRVDEDTYEVAPAMIVRRNGKTFLHLSSRLFRVEPGQAYGLVWRVPRVPKAGGYSFCVTLTNRAAKKSAQSCAKITLR